MLGRSDGDRMTILVSVPWVSKTSEVFFGTECSARDVVIELRDDVVAKLHNAGLG
jgi:hypothetical protein